VVNYYSFCMSQEKSIVFGNFSAGSYCICKLVGGFGAIT